MWRYIRYWMAIIHNDKIELKNYSYNWKYVKLRQSVVSFLVTVQSSKHFLQ